VIYWKVPGAEGVLKGDWKLIVPASGKSAPELYNLAGDPFEQKNLAAEHPSRVQSMQRLMADCLARTAEP
jgi:hypothetical protein